MVLMTGSSYGSQDRQFVWPLSFLGQAVREHRKFVWPFSFSGQAVHVAALLLRTGSSWLFSLQLVWPHIFSDGPV